MNNNYKKLQAGEMVVSDYLVKNGDFLPFVFTPFEDGERTKCQPHLGGSLAAILCFPAGSIQPKKP